MRYAIIADIHANLAAFTAVLDEIERLGGADKTWCLGDVAGYGPDPHECIKLLRRADHVCVAGNHDWAAIGKVSTDDFNPDAAAASRWTARQLNPEDKEYLETLPLVIAENDFTLVHGSPREPIREYILSLDAARENFTLLKSQYCLVGHSHIPMLFSVDEDGAYSSREFITDTGIVLGKDRMIINPGSVGQPRDGDPRASFAIYDSETREVRLHRVPYDIHVTQDRMKEHSLPARLISRLSYGI